MDVESASRGTLRIERDASAPTSFRIAGEMDISNASLLVQAVRPFTVEGGELVLRLAEPEFMDSSGIQALLEIARHLGPSGRLVISSPSTAVARVLRIVGVDRFPSFAILES